MPPRGATHHELVLLRRAGLLYGKAIPYGVDVSLAMWAFYIEQQPVSDRPRDYIRDGDYLPPDDAVLNLQALSERLCHGVNLARTY